MTTVEIDREKAAAAALDWFRAYGLNRFRFGDPDMLESAAGLAIVKALETFDPDVGASLQSWIRSKMIWAAQDALRTTEGGVRGKAKLAGKKSFRLSTFEDPDNLLAFEEDKDAALFTEDVINVLKTEKDTRTAHVLVSRIQGKTLKAIGEDIGVSESRASQINKEALKANIVDIRVFREKECKDCGRIKQESDFLMRGRNRKGTRAECKECTIYRRHKRPTIRPKKLPWPKKICTKCRSTKNVSEFYAQSSGRHGVMPLCSRCERASQKERRLCQQ